MLTSSRKFFALSMFTLSFATSALADTYLACGNPFPLSRKESFNQAAPVYFEYVAVGTGKYSKAKLKINGIPQRIKHFREAYDNSGYAMESGNVTYAFDETICLKEGDDPVGSAVLTISHGADSRTMDCSCTDD
ncbi:hypothetical protein WDW86_10520 [Bdellovibrionota bacterium FG-2]